jgi:hypothetical protein
VQSVICAPPLSGCLGGKPCPDRWEISTFRNSANLQEAYADIKKGKVSGSNKGQCNGLYWGGEGPWSHGPGKPGGRRFCYLEDNEAVVVWTHEKLGQPNHIDVLGTASLGGGDHLRLHNWWRFWHHLIGKCQETDCTAKLQ